MVTTVRNDRSGEVIQSPLTHVEACRIFGEATACKEHWLHFWLHKYAIQFKADADRKASATPVNVAGGVINSSFIGDMFVVAVGYGLKRPMIRLHHQGQRFKLYLSKAGSLCVKTGKLAPLMDASGLISIKDKWTNDPVGDEEYMGFIAPSGDFVPARVGYSQGFSAIGRYGRRIAQPIEQSANGGRDTRHLRTMTDCEKDFLAQLTADPIGFMAKCSKDMCRCCYCYKALEDARSKLVGYGKTCAQHWGLSWGSSTRDENAPSFAKRYGPDIAAMCHTIKINPVDTMAWEVLADALEEASLPRCKKPDGKVTTPRI